MVIDSLGNLGIGTNSPDNKLHVRKESVAGSAVYPLKVASMTPGGNASSGDGVGMLFNIGNNGSNDFTDQARIIVKQTFFGVRPTFSIDTLDYDDHSTFVERLFINPTGNVGVGTDNPSSGKLVVQQSSDSITTGLTVRNSNNQSSFFWMDNSNKMRIDNGSTSSRDFIFNGNGTGKVGIGTDSPSESLEVNGSSKLGNIRFTGGSTTNYIQSDLDLKFSPVNTSVGTRMTIKSSGNVGIGNTSPSSKLHVTSSSNTDSGGVIVESNNLGKYTYQYFDSSDNYIIKNGATAFRDICFNPGGTGKIGIGTDSPSEKLEVNGNVKADDFILSSDENLKQNVKDFDKESLNINVKTYELKNCSWS